MQGQGRGGPEINSDRPGYNTDFPPAGKSEETWIRASVVTVDFRVGHPSKAGGDTMWTMAARTIAM